MVWNENSSECKPPEKHLCEIRLHDGTVCLARWYTHSNKFNKGLFKPQWRREGDMPKKERWIEDFRVGEWRELPKQEK